jgi:hypothetical protein
MDTSERERAAILAACGGDAEVARAALLVLGVYRRREDIKRT